MVANCRSSGVATAEAIVSGLAPGTVAVTRIVGNHVGQIVYRQRFVSYPAKNNKGRHDQGGHDWSNNKNA